MKCIKDFCILLIFFVKLSFCLRLEDLLSIRYDIVRVRNESLSRAMDSNAVLDFVSI